VDRGAVLDLGPHDLDGATGAICGSDSFVVHHRMEMPAAGVNMVACAFQLYRSGSIQNANEDVMNIYVGNLPFTITEDKLKDLFVGFGKVTSINLITDKTTGEPRGFGFVEMPTQSEAEAAIKGLNGTSVGGMTIQVNIARDRRRGRR